MTIQTLLIVFAIYTLAVILFFWLASKVLP